VANGEIKPEDINEDTIEQELDTAGLPAPDLMIRTSGEQRISNFLLWQLAYSELYFTSVPWPEFDKNELAKAVEAYNNRDRRYGLVKEE
jgi:undecaprenyl diphosphate synthase